MTPSQAWKRLGIARTEDQRAIRGAYAAALKAIDPDTDPAAFAALREARDLALAMGRERRLDALCHEPARDHAVLAMEADTPVCDPLPDSEPMPRRDVAADTETERLVAHADALVQLLHRAEPDDPLTPEEARAAADHVAALLADPAMEAIDRHADVGRWFAYLLARTSPRSDPLLAQPADRFGWRGDAGRVDQDPAAAFLTDRLSAIEFWHALSEPGHRLHTAWRELRKPAHEKSTRGLLAPRKRVRELLTTMRARFPQAEQWFDPWRIALWEEGRGPFRIASVTPWLFVLWIGISLLSALSDSGPPTSIAPPPLLLHETPLSDERADVAAAIEGALGDAMSPTQLAERNPTLDTLLRTNWRIYREAGDSRAKYLDGMRTLLLDRAQAADPVPGSPLALATAEQELKILTALAPRPDRCVSYVGGSAAAFASLPAALREDSRTLALRLAVEGAPRADKSRGPRSTMLDGPTVDAIAKASGLPDARLRAAMQGSGTDADRCRVQIAVRQVALALPPRRRDRLLAAL